MSEDTKDTIVQVLTVVAVILTSILGRSAPRICNDPVISCSGATFSRRAR